MTIIGFQGVAGSFSEQALEEYFGPEAERQCFPGFADLFAAVSRRQVDFGVVPVENSATGAIAEIYDLLRIGEVFIVGEKIVHIDQNLLTLPGAQLADIREIYSHPQGFRQSAEFLKKHPQWRLIPYTNTAASAAYIQEQGDLSKAAIASKKAAQRYGLKVAAASISSIHGNFTRFAVIGPDHRPEADADKISLFFSLPHRPGALHQLLGYFAQAGLSLMKIESRPILGRPWEYFFFVDFQGNLGDPVVREAVDQVARNSSFYKMLGNYKGDQSY